MKNPRLPGWRARSRLGRLVLAAGLTLAGAAVAVAAGPSPAQAAVVDASTFAAAGTVAESATATCPAGEWLSGAGGAINGGGGDVTLTDIIPDLATASVTVWGHTNSAAAPSFTVVAEAICVPGPPPANYQLVQNVSALDATTPKSLVAACPAGTNLLGSGFRLRQAFGRVFLRAMMPQAGVTHNGVTAVASGGFAGNWDVTAYGICGTPAFAPPSVVAQASASNTGNSKSSTASACPLGMLTTGVGGATASTSAIGGFVLIDEMTASLVQDTSTAEAVEGFNPGGGVSWYVNSYNICWDF